MKTYISLSLLLIVLPLIRSEDEKEENVLTLCQKPQIQAADRLPNNTVRVYRDGYYWELENIPSKTGRTKGPFKVWYQHMAPVDRGSAVQTVLGNVGNAKGLTYKFKGQKYWIWDSKDGKLIKGGKAGYTSNAIPSGGFEAVLNDGGLAEKGFPMMIGFKGTKVYYLNFKEGEFRTHGPPAGATNGAFKEKFPSDITAAFSWPAESGSDQKFYVYLFQNKKHCFRPYIGEDNCKEWRDNLDLFGCKDKPNPEPNPEPTPESKPRPPPEAANVETTTEPNGCGSDQWFWIGKVFLFALLINLIINI